MTGPADPNKGAIPLDASASPKEAEAGEARYAADDPIAQMCMMLSHLYNEARAGRVKAMSVTFVDDSGVPQNGYYVGPGAAVAMLGGLTIAADALKEGAKRAMDGYLEFLRKKAEAESAAGKQTSDTGGVGETGKPN